ncbi:hypothetical protein [Azospirillum brasilense]|uniref:hypothetical protein n=1 Tax=Azospirillum brasilense TaxID=192 RepID=UPI0011A44A1E|nr:hypothetical protein [Azospirillum brasilense]
MTSPQEFAFLFIKEAAFMLMERGIPSMLARNQIGFLVRRLVEKETIVEGARVELLFGRKGETPVMCFVRQAVHLRIFQRDAIREEWVRIQIPRHEIDLIAPPPLRPAANGNARMLADGTTGQPLPAPGGYGHDVGTAGPGRPTGTGFSEADRKLMPEMMSMVKTGRTPWAAALKLAEKAAGGGMLNSKAKRLLGAFREFQRISAPSISE